ncbi:MAG: hypothetical protein ACRD2B_00515 [Terriglobia bacterium]
MNRARLVSLLAAIAVVVAFATASAFATDVDVTNTSGFGTLVATLSPSTTLTTADYSATLTESVYLSGTTYSYVYTASNSSTSTAGLTSASTSTIANPNANNFSSGLDFGVVTGSTSANLDDSGFTFNPSSLAVGMTGGTTNTVVAGDMFTFYAQSTLGPQAGSFSTQDGGLSNAGHSLDPAVEPSSITLVGLVLLGGLLYERKRLFA